MKKILVLSALLCLSTFAVFAQEVVTSETNFTGKWELDAGKSKFDEGSRIEAMTMTVAQTDRDIRIEIAAKRAEGSRDAGGTNRDSGNSTFTYTLDGKETKDTQDSPMGEIPVVLRANLDGGRLKLNQTRTINTQRGVMTIKIKETWSLSADGMILTVKRETETPRGTRSSVLVFTMKQMRMVLRADTVNTQGPVESVAVGEQTDSTRTAPNLKTVSGGVVNSKARNLVIPKYPNSAKAARVSGAVAVAVTIDEAGKVISANAVSGHPLLRAAAEEAARASEFNPTLLEGRPVKVTGTIVYNFVP